MFINTCIYALLCLFLSLLTCLSIKVFEAVLILIQSITADIIPAFPPSLRTVSYSENEKSGYHYLYYILMHLIT